MSQTSAATPKGLTTLRPYLTLLKGQELNLIAAGFSDSPSLKQTALPDQA